MIRLTIATALLLAFALVGYSLAQAIDWVTAWDGRDSEVAK